jgi:hypothetical protein
MAKAIRTEVAGPYRGTGFVGYHGRMYSKVHERYGDLPGLGRTVITPRRLHYHK